MNTINLFRNTILPLIITSILYFNRLSVFAAPIQPGVPILADPQFQTCLNEAVQANGWTLTEELLLALLSTTALVLIGIFLLIDLYSL